MDTIGTVLFAVLILVSGSFFLYFGAEGLVKGTSSLAIRRGLTPLVVGLTIVTYGTSSPELVSAITATLKGNPAIGIGNIIGANICNIALVLGVASLLSPLRVNLRLIKIDILIMIGVTFVLIVMLLDNYIGIFEGIILLLGFVAYTFGTLYYAKKDTNQNAIQPIKVIRDKTWYDIYFITGGLIILIIGANLFIKGAVDIARFMGVSDLVIGLSIVALGTSLPELATSIVAAVKKEGDISIGNVVGANIFNILFILGLAAVIHPMMLTGGNVINYIDISVMIVVSIILLPLAWTKYEISRFEGAFLFLIYIGYMYYIYAFRIHHFAHFF